MEEVLYLRRFCHRVSIQGIFYLFNSLVVEVTGQFILQTFFLANASKKYLSSRKTILPKIHLKGFINKMPGSTSAEICEDDLQRNFVWDEM